LLRKINRKAKKRVFTLIFLFVFFMSSQALIFSSPVSASVEERDISVEWGDNVFQNLPYTYSGTFYENTDPTDAWDTAKIEFTYIPDPTVTYDESVVEDFTNSEFKFASGEENFTFTDGSGAGFDNLSLDDNDYSYFNYTGIGLYNATYSFTDVLDGTEGDSIDLIQTDNSDANCGVEIIGVMGDHKKVLEIDDQNAAGRAYFFCDDISQTSGTVEFWFRTTDVTKDTSIFFWSGASNTIRVQFSASKIKYSDGGVYQDAIDPAVNDVWYHIRIVFDCTPDTFDLYIDNILIDSGIDFDNAVASILFIYVSTSDGHTWYTSYVDAIDFSWDPSYELGRNREENWVPIDYEATYSFEDDATGSVPSGWGDEAYVGVVSAFNKHNQVIELERDGFTPIISQTFTDGAQTSGTVEFWFGSDDVTHLSHARLYSSGSDGIYISLGTEKLQYYDSGYHDITSAKDNVMYHIRIDFECAGGAYEGLAADTFYIYVNGVKFGAYPFKVAVDDIQYLYFTCNTGAVYNAYVDAVGYSWETYEIGDNYKFTPSMIDNYPASYSFYKQPVFTSNADIDWLNSYLAGTCVIIPEFNGHSKVMNYSHIAATNNYHYHEGQASGTIEFWAYNPTGNSVYYRNFDYPSFYQPTSIRIYNNNVRIHYGNGAGGTIYNTVLLSDTWHHYKIQFDCDTDKQSVWIDGILELNNENFQGDLDANWFYRDNLYAPASYQFYLDAIGYSWDNRYLIGDNLNDNFYQGYENFEGYNETEYGNYFGTYSFDDIKTEEGVYYGTYDFRDDADGEDPAGWTITDESGGTINVIAEKDGHKKVVQFYDDSDVDLLKMENSFSSQIDPTIEFWWAFNSSDAGSNQKYLLFYFYEGATIPVQLILNYPLEGYIQIRNSAPAWVTVITGLSNNTMHHIKLIFDDTNNETEIFVNGISFGEFEYYINTTTGIDKIQMETRTNSADPVYHWLDAFGYSWDTTSHSGLGYTPSWNANSYDIEPLFDTFDNLGIIHNTTISILNELDGHNNVLNISDNTPDGVISATDTFTNQPSGTIEYWFYSTDTTKATHLKVRYGTTDKIHLYVNSGKLQYYDGASHNIAPLASDAWYHIRIDFECAGGAYEGLAADHFHVYLNGTHYGDYAFQTVSDNLNNFYFATSGVADIGYSIYLDALGHSWDSDYTVGDNINAHGKEVITELESEGWTVTNNVFADVGISGEFNSHKKFLNLTDNSPSLNIYVENSFNIGQISGTIEFYWKTSDVTKECYVRILNQDSARSMYLYTDASKFKYYDGASNDIQAAVNNIWYHFRLVFDCTTDTYDIWVDGILMIDDADFENVATTLDSFAIVTNGIESGYTNYYDALHYSWEDTNIYFKGEHTEHCDIEAVIDFEVIIPFEYYESFILQVSMDSRHYTNVHTNISWSFYNFTSSSWTEINDYSAIAETLREFDDSDVSVGISGLFDSSGNMKFRYYGYNCSAFYLEIDELTSNVYFGTQFEYEHTLKLLGTWKYRFKLDVGLGTEHITDWIYFNLIEQPANFEGISESRYSTRWVLTSTATTGELTEVYYDDLTSGYWDLSDFSSRTFTKQVAPDHDSYIDSNNPTSNYGSATDLWIDDSPVQIIYLGFPELNYLTENSSGCDTWIYLEHRVTWTSGTNGKFYETGSFDESTITYSTRPSDVQLLKTTTLSQGGNWYSLNTESIYQYYSIHSDNGVWRFYSYEWTARYPQLKATINKHYHTTTGEGYSYMQTSSTESLGLVSSKASSNTSLNEGDVFTVDLQSTSDNALLKLYSGGVLQQTINLLTANTETSRQEVEVIVSEDVSFDQIKITSELGDTEYFKLYDIKAEHWVFESEEDQKIMHVEPYGQNELILNLGNNSLKIYENDILRTDTYITMTYDLTTHIFESPIPETVFVSFYDSNNDYLDFNQFTTYVNYTLFEENFVNQRLTNREFYVDEDSTIYFNVYDSFDVNIYSASRLAKTFIDITLNVYTLKIKNEALDDSSYTLTKGSVDKTGILFPDEIDEYKIASGSYTFAYIKGSDPEESIDFDLSGDKLLKINRSQMCFLSYTNQRGEYLNFNQFKTYWNGTLLYENVFYEDIGNNVSIEIKDHYDISVKNHTFIVSSGDNYVPIILTMFSLKVFNQQELFNHINITRDPNYYESGYSWSEWVAPTEIIEFTLFAGYYKINLTDNENSGSSYYSYTLNGDDILLISSGNTISNLIINIANVNTTIGNQITNVQIDLTNQNSNINNTIINIDINLSNVNSTLGTLLTNINLDIININNNISNLYTFTENNFLNLGNNINNSFISIENNIIAINQTISTLVIGLDGKITVVNATINTMFTEMNSQFIVTQSTLDFSFTFLNQTITQIGNNITENHIALNNLIIQRANEIDNSLIQISTLVNLINSSVVNESLVIQSLVNIIGNNITENHVIINDLINLIGNNITENNVNMVSLIELTGNNITTNQFVIQTLIDYVSNNITENHLEFLTNINLINNTIGQNQIELINRLLFINNSINTMALDLTNQILLVNNTIYSAILDVSTSIDFNSDNILGNISLTYQQNDFLTELYKETMFSQLLNWSDVAYNYSLMEDRIDVWEFINNYKNQSIEVHLRYQDIIDNLTITAQNSILQYLPKDNTDYNLWSVEDQEYLDEWKPLPENRTVDFGFYEEKIPIDPNPFFMDFVNFSIFVMVIGVIGLLGLFFYFRIRYQQNKLNPRTYKKKRNVGQGTYNDGEVI